MAQSCLTGSELGNVVSDQRPKSPAHPGRQDYSLDPEGPARAALEFLQGLLQSSLRELKTNAEAPAPSGSESRREAG